MTSRRSLWAGLLAGFGLVVPASGADDDLSRELPRIPASAPAEALAALRVRPGFRVALSASEPAVTDPVAACFDADGRL